MHQAPPSLNSHIHSQEKTMTPMLLEASLAPTRARLMSGLRSLDVLMTVATSSSKKSLICSVLTQKWRTTCSCLTRRCRCEIRKFSAFRSSRAATLPSQPYVRITTNGRPRRRSSVKSARLSSLTDKTKSCSPR